VLVSQPAVYAASAKMEKNEVCTAEASPCFEAYNADQLCDRRVCHLRCPGLRAETSKGLAQRYARDLDHPSNDRSSPKIRKIAPETDSAQTNKTATTVALAGAKRPKLTKIIVSRKISTIKQAAEIRRSAARPTTDLSAYDLYLRALAAFNHR
jgi:hypothetical protein